MKLKKQMEDTYPPEKAKQVAFAVATQMAHKTGKSPKTFVSKQTGHKERFGTPEGRSEAKAKFDKPKSEYKKTASAIMFDGFADELQKIAGVAGIGEEVLTSLGKLEKKSPWSTVRSLKQTTYPHIRQAGPYPEALHEQEKALLQARSRLHAPPKDKHEKYWNAMRAIKQHVGLS
jgi:hypothetical protein